MHLLYRPCGRLHSTSEEQLQEKSDLLRLSAMISQYFTFHNVRAWNPLRINIGHRKKNAIMMVDFAPSERSGDPIARE